MNITADAVLFSSYHQGDLTVGFQTHQTIDYMSARLLQHLRPDDIVLLIETGLQLHQNRNLLAVLCRLGQSCDDRRITADTVQCLLDSQYLRIVGRVLYKLHHRIKGLVRMM